MKTNLKVKFYSKKELQELKAAIKQGNKPSEIAKMFHEKWPDRSYDGLMYKLCDLRGTLGTRTPLKKLEIQEPALINVAKVKRAPYKKKNNNTFQQPAIIEVEHNVPDGFQFNGQPRKVTLCSDHFRIYF